VGVFLVLNQRTEQTGWYGGTLHEMRERVEIYSLKCRPAELIESVLEENERECLERSGWLQDPVSHLVS
jgi:hypothetical protein